jgi:transcriptional regulator with XRE-family HTH domain
VHAEDGLVVNDHPAHVVIGRRVRRLRTERQLTLKQLEESSGLSATHLSEIERGRTSPTLGALSRIARALGRDASYFVEQRELEDIAHVPRERVAGFLAGGARVEALTPGVPGGHLFAYRVQVPATGFVLPAGDGEALYLVRRGDVEADFGGARVDLGPGDSAQARRDIPHTLRAAGEPPDGPVAEIIALVSQRIEEA